MIIAVGSINRVKVLAVEEVLKDYPLFASAHVLPVAAPSEVSEQPMSLEEAIRGAKNRAKNAFKIAPKCKWSFGLESGFIHAEGSKTGYLETCICAIYDGNDYSIGMSCGLEIPPHILSIILEEGKDLGQACYKSGITNNANLGSGDGVVGILTNGRVNRKEYTKQGIVAALVQVEHPALYQNKVLAV